MASSHNGVDVSHPIVTPTPAVRQRIANALQTLRGSADRLDNYSASVSGRRNNQQQHLNHGENTYPGMGNGR